MNEQNCTFKQLSSIDVSRFVEKKGMFSYLSWPYAVAQLRLADPSATWEVKRFDGLPYLFTGLGYFVEVAVTVQGLTLSQIHPVLDSRNRPITKPTPFDINTSIQRGLVKAIALHGLGLNVYAGEDLPIEIESDAKTTSEPESDNVHEISSSLGSPVVPTVTINQLRYIDRLINETGTDIDAVLEYFGVEDLSLLPKSEASRVITTLEQQKRAA